MSDIILAQLVDPDRAFLRSIGWISPRIVDRVLEELPPDSLPDDRREREQWLLFAAMQHFAANQNADRLGRVYDERLNAYVDGIATNTLPDDLTKLSRWLKYLPANRARKHDRRQLLIERYRHDLCRPALPPPDHHAEQTDELLVVRAKISRREWALLWRATEENLKSIAISERMKIGTLKSLLSRCRVRVRDAS